MKLKDQTFWALADQAAVSGGNFLTSLILARSLSRAEFGTYSLLFLTLLSINTLQHALVIYPLSLDVARNFRQSVPVAVGRAIAHTLVLDVVWIGLVFSILAILERVDLLPVMALAMITWHVQEIARQSFFASGQIHWSILPDIISYIGQATLLYLAHFTRLMPIFFCIAATSGGALVLQLFLIRPVFSKPFQQEVLRRSWGLGKFNLVANLMGMAILQSPAWTLDLFSGRAAVGSYQALANLIGIANPIVLSMGTILMPAVARASMLGRSQARRSAIQLALRFGLLLLPCFLFFGLFPHQVMSLVYGQTSPYIALSSLLRIFTINFVLQFLTSVVGGYEGGLARPQSYMYSQLWYMLAWATIGVLCVRSFGIAGAVYAGLTSAVVRLIAYSYLSFRSDYRASEQLKISEGPLPAGTSSWN